VAAEALFRDDPCEPLCPWLRERAAPAPDVRGFDLEFSSRGDRVPARILLPARREGRRPLVLAQHGAGGHKGAPYMDSACLPWARHGAAVVSIDFPLHGERANAKLTERLLGALSARDATDVDAWSIWIEFVRQAVADLRRALDAAGAHEEVDAQRAAYVGFSLGAMLGAVFCAEEARIRAAALAIGGAGLGPSAVDPATHVGRIAPRPLLFVNALRDERVPRARAEALHQAAAEPKEVLWFDATHRELPGAALKAIWSFLRVHLGITAV
jgi:uncharacterized protein